MKREFVKSKYLPYSFKEEWKKLNEAHKTIEESISNIVKPGDYVRWLNSKYQGRLALVKEVCWDHEWYRDEDIAIQVLVKTVSRDGKDFLSDNDHHHCQYHLLGYDLEVIK